LKSARRRSARGSILIGLTVALSLAFLQGVGYAGPKPIDQVTGTVSETTEQLSGDSGPGTTDQTGPQQTEP
jgi:hypothetical protein